MPTLRMAPAKNYWSTSLNGAINNSVTTITLTSTTNLRSPGYLVIDREDGSGTATPSAREVVSYTGISGSDVTGVTRGDDGSTAAAHSDGALVESVMTVGVYNDLTDFLAVSLATTTGVVLPISTQTITNVRGTNITGSTASITTVYAKDLAGVRGQFYWSRAGALATVRHAVATDTHFPLQRVTKNLTINSTYISLISAPSLAAFEADISYGSAPTGDFATIYTTKPTIDIGEWDTSTAATASALSLTSLASGSLLRYEINDHGNSGGMATSLQVTSRK